MDRGGWRTKRSLKWSNVLRYAAVVRTAGMTVEYARVDPTMYRKAEKSPTPR
jgi:hypothetical protein